MEFSRLQDFEERTRFGISLAEEKKVEGIFLREDHQIGLGIARGQAGRGFVPFPSSGSAFGFLLGVSNLMFFILKTLIASKNHRVKMEKFILDIQLNAENTQSYKARCV